MRSLLFLVRKSAWNRLLQLRRKPARLVLYLILVALIVVSFAGATGSVGQTAPGTSDIGWLKLIFLAYLLLMAYSSVAAGLSSGASIFEMSDVNLLFASPVNPKQILVYGLARQAVRSMFASIFILFMGDMLRSTWGVEVAGMLGLFVVYILSMLVFQILAVVLYMYVAGRPRAKMAVGLVGFGMLLPTVLAVMLPYIQGATLESAALGAVHGNVLYSLPVAGWLTQGVFGWMAQDTGAALLGLGLTLGLVALALGLLTAGKSDYYEDVLVAAETTFRRRQAALEGNLEGADAGRRVALKKGEQTEIWGGGASVFLGKHMLEDFRRNRLKLLDGAAVGGIFTAVLMGFFLRGEGAQGILSILITVLFMRMFTVGTGRGLKELSSHYIFMVPAGSFAKIVWSNMELGVKSLVEGVLAFGIAGAMVGAGILDIVMCVLVSTMFSVLLIAVNLLSMRIFANVVSQGLLVTLYILFVVLVMVPGVVAAVLCTLWVQPAWGMVAAFGTLLLWEALLSALFFFLARGVLHSCDMESAGAAIGG